jgi:hypothetical protein
MRQISADGATSSSQRYVSHSLLRLAWFKLTAHTQDSNNPRMLKFKIGRTSGSPLMRLAQHRINCKSIVALQIVRGWILPRENSQRADPARRGRRRVQPSSREYVQFPNYVGYFFCETWHRTYSCRGPTRPLPDSSFHVSFLLRLVGCDKHLAPIPLGGHWLKPP